MLRKAWSGAAVCAVVALAGVTPAVAASPVPEPGRDVVVQAAPGTASPGNPAVDLWLDCTGGGNVRMNWSNSGPTGDWDWVGLYREDPGTVGQNGYVTYQWATYGNTYTTSETAGRYWLGYWSWDYATGRYVLQKKSGPHLTFCR